jgi:uncharacterized SAM-binding protein YcdF (DUF218 family)
VLLLEPHKIAGPRAGPAALARAAASLAVVLTVAALLPPVRGALADGLLAGLESRFARAEIGDAAAIAGVIALGGGEARIREAGRLARRHRHLLVLVSGAGDRAHVLALLGPGLEPERVLVETRSRNTHENALFSAAAIPAKAGGRWLLVTSASHMPRAVGAFRRQGLAVEPWPIHDLAGDRPFAVAQHEVLGLLAYRLLGRTSALFPSPDR